MYIRTATGLRRAGLALGLMAALGPGIASADETREAALEQRITELERQLQALMNEVKAQREQVESVVAAPPPPPPPPAAPPSFTTGKGLTVALHGFIAASAFTQDGEFTFGNGQNALYPAAGTDGNLSGFDIRNTRFWLDITGARLNDTGTGGGRIEMDFFGGFNGTGAYSRQQPTPRLRQAYLDLANDKGSTVRIGQQWDLMFPIDAVPASVTHLAFPLGFGSGMIGWRFPGVVWMQNINRGSDGAKLRFDVGAFDGSWSGPGNNVNYATAGNVDFRPQIQGRLRAQGSNWVAWAAAHYSSLDLRGVAGNIDTPLDSKITSHALEVGGSWNPGNFMLKGMAYTGNGIGHLFGALSQFGDISEVGGFAQVGYKFTPEWSANAFYSVVLPDKNDVIRWMGNGAGGKLRNQQAAVNVQYASGAYAIGVEFLRDKLRSTSDGANRQDTTGNQLSVSAMYKF